MSTTLRRRPGSALSGRRGGPPDRVPTVDRVAALCPPVLLGTVAGGMLLARCLGVRPSGAVGVAVLLAGLLAGLPHGALDLDRLGRGRRPGAVAVYAAAALTVFGLWLLAPAPTLIALLALALAHFGAGDLAGATRSGRAPTGAVRAAFVLALGGLPVVLPFVVAPQATRPLLDRLADGADPVLVAARVALPVVVGCAVAVVAWAVRARRPRVAVEVVVLAVTFLAVPPLVAFGVYFGGWHALRSSAQLVRESAGPRPDGAALRALARRAVVPTAGALAAIAALVAARGWDLPAADLALLLSITVPHSAVSAWCDSR